jgi:riboflavin kinase/FMN adenylyltransferase
VVLPFDARLASQSPQAFIDEVPVRGLGVRYVLVGDDFRFGAKRAGDYAMLDAAGQALGFDVARMNSYEVHGLARVQLGGARGAGAPAGWRMPRALLGRPTASAAMWCTGASWAALGASSGQQAGRRLSHPEPALFAHWKPAASGIFAVLVHGLDEPPPAGRGQPGRAPLAGPG